MTESCGTCRFYFNQGNDKVCRRHAPVMVVNLYVAEQPQLVLGAKGRNPGQPLPWAIEAKQMASAFPMMEPNGWCGDYEPSTAVVRQ